MAAGSRIGHNISVFYPPTERGANLPTEHLRIAGDEGRFECDSLRVRQDG
jgi:hypothetical protein